MKDTSVPDRGQISPQALERFERPRNYGPLPRFNGHARITGSCGDTIEVWIRVGKQRDESLHDNQRVCTWKSSSFVNKYRPIPKS